jgi:tetratricopeptide (TPR) repeat protein
VSAGRTACALLLAAALLVPAARASSSFPDLGPADHLDRGIKLYREGELERAQVELKRSVALDPRLVSAHYHLAKIHLIGKDSYRAFYALREVLALEPQNAKARKLLRELTPELLARVSADIKARRNLAIAYNVMGFLLIAQGRIEAGVKREEYALELDPKLAEAYDDLAWAAYKEKDLERAFEMASKAFELDPLKGSITSHYQQLFNLKRLGVPFPAAAPRPPPEQVATAAVSDATNGHPPIDPGVLSGAIQPVRASDLEAMVGEDDQLVADYLKNATFASAAPKPSPKAPAPAAPAASGDQARKAKVLEEARKALDANYELARKKEEAKDFTGALQIYELIRATDRGFQDVAVRVADIRRTLEALSGYEDAIAALKSHRYNDALSTLNSLDRGYLSRARDVKSLDNLIGEAAWGARQMDVAKVHLKKWLEANPGDAAARYLLVKTLQAQSDWPAALEEVTLLMDRHRDATTRWPDLWTLKAKFWVKSYFAVVLALALLWGSLTSGYVYTKLVRGARARSHRHFMEKMQILVKKEKWPDVIKETEKLPDFPYSRVEEIWLGVHTGMALLNTGETSKAAKLERELLSQYPEEPTVQHLDARIKLANRDFSEEAIEGYGKLVSVEPNNRALLEALNQHYQAHAPESADAAKWLDRLLELDPTNPDFRYFRALRHLRQKDFSDVAKNVYTRVLEIDPGRADVRAGLARCHFEARNYLEAIKAAKTAMETDLKNPELHKMLLTSYERLSMKSEAAKEYRQMVARHPEMPELKAYLAQIESLTGGGETDDAATDEAAALYDKGLKAYHEARYKDAVGPLTAAYNVERWRLSAGTVLVRCYVRLREPKHALAIFERLEVTSIQKPDDFLLGLCYDVADVYAREKKNDRAIELYGYICSKDPGYRDAFQRFEDLRSETQRV